jgi:hypothetical protein
MILLRKDSPKSHEERRIEAEKIKEIINDFPLTKNYDNYQEKPVPISYNHEAEPDEEFEINDIPSPLPTAPYGRKEQNAPLFVKVDKYNEILANIEDTRVLLNGIKNVFPLLLEIDAVKKDSIDTLRVTMQRIEKNILLLDTELLRPGQPRIGAEPSREGGQVQDSLTKLQNHLESLKSELQRMKE